MKQLVYLTFSLLIFLTSCTTSKTTVSSAVDLSNYEYASVINNDVYHIPAELMEYEIQLYDAVEGSRLKLVGDNLIDQLTPDQQSKLLLVKYGVRVDKSESIVTVNFVDYFTGRPVVSCRGAYGLALDNGGDLRTAIKKVREQISKTFLK